MGRPCPALGVGWGSCHRGTSFQRWGSVCRVGRFPQGEPFRARSALVCATRGRIRKWASKTRAARVCVASQRGAGVSGPFTSPRPPARMGFSKVTGGLMMTRALCSPRSLERPALRDARVPRALAVVEGHGRVRPGAAVRAAAGPSQLSCARAEAQGRASICFRRTGRGGGCVSGRPGEKGDGAGSGVQQQSRAQVRAGTPGAASHAQARRAPSVPTVGGPRTPRRTRRAPGSNGRTSARAPAAATPCGPAVPVF